MNKKVMHHLRYSSGRMMCLLLLSVVILSCSLSVRAENLTEDSRWTMEDGRLQILSYDGDPVAAYILGLRYDYGLDRDQNLQEAFQWYTTAAQLDYAPAMVQLGYYYMNTDQDEPFPWNDTWIYPSRYWFSLASERGDVEGDVGLIRWEQAHFPGESVTEDFYTEDTSENTTASDESDVSNVGVFALRGRLERAVRAENGDGLLMKGICLDTGWLYTKDPLQARQYYQRAAATEVLDPTDQWAVNEANTRLGLSYAAEEDWTTALFYFLIAAEKNYAPAQYYTGMLHEKGLGMEANAESAWEWYERAADQDYAPALNQLGCMYFNARGTAFNAEEAVYYQKRAAAQGYGPAQINLAYLYENGYGVEQDYRTAYVYYQLAKEQGYAIAQEGAARVRGKLEKEETFQ